MRVFLDSSVFAKRYIEEKGSQAVEDLCQPAKALALSVICIPEIISALNRRVREKTIARNDYQAIKQALLEDIRDIVIIDLTPEVISTSIKLLETSPLRAMDALHIACALRWKADLFVSSDKRQLSSAQKAGLPTKLM
jgi:predicted nucleic acid-binding protein